MQYIAVLITCYNRREKTVNCLNLLFKCGLPVGFALKVYLVDDGSTDGTGEEVRKLFPEIKVIVGSGELYWAGGMRLAWTEAIRDEPEYLSLIHI